MLLKFFFFTLVILRSTNPFPHEASNGTQLYETGSTESLKKEFWKIIENLFAIQGDVLRSGCRTPDAPEKFESRQQEIYDAIHKLAANMSALSESVEEFKIWQHEMLDVTDDWRSIVDTKIDKFESKINDVYQKLKNLSEKIGDVSSDLRKVVTRVGCPSEWSYYNSSCYKIFCENTTWEEAEQFCKLQGAHLASIHSEAEHNFVRELFDSHAPSCNIRYIESWIGLRSRKRGLQYEWTWVDGTEFTYEKWNANQSRNDDLQCGEFVPTLKYNFWEREECEFKNNRVVCKK